MLKIFVTFFLFFFRERKRQESDQRKQKETGANIPWKFAQKHEWILGCRKGCYCDHFYKNARKTLAFSGCLFHFSLDLMLWVVAGATRQYFMYEKPRAALCERVFGEPFRTTTVFLSSFCERLSSFFLERRKKNAEKLFLNYTQNIRLNQIKICN